jgi:hypothetical protein
MRLSANEQGQSVSEYSLMLAFVFLLSLCLFLSGAGNISSIWEAADNLIGHGISVKPTGK